MARKMTPVRTLVFHDEFDNPPEGPVGIHRGKRSVAARFLPYLITIFVAVLVGFIVWAWWGGKAADFLHINTTGTGDQNITLPKQQTTEGNPNVAPPLSPNVTQNTPSAEGTLNSNSSNSDPSSSVLPIGAQTSIRIYNGSGIAGLAYQKAQILRNAGYGQVADMNLTDGYKPPVNTVWYRNNSDLPTAEAIARKLNINMVAQRPAIQVPIAIVYVR